MGQTPEGAKKAAQTAKARYGPDHHRKIGSKGGKTAEQLFKKDPEMARQAGKKGGAAKKGWRKQAD